MRSQTIKKKKVSRRTRHRRQKKKSGGMSVFGVHVPGTARSEVPGTTKTPSEIPEPQGRCNGICQNGSGEKIYDNGDIYVGTFENDGKKVEGTFTFDQGHTVYRGKFQNGYFNDENGTLTYTDKNNLMTVYEGSFVNSKFQGRGTLTTPTSTYVGYWTNGKHYGQGTKQFTTGASYQGTWEDGKMKKGTFYMANDQERFEGEWTPQHIFNGTKILSNGEQYILTNHLQSWQ